MRPDTEQRLVVFAKAPLMGRAKTRLAAGIGAVHAQRLYRAMTARILRRVTDPRWNTVLAVSPDRAKTHRVWQGWGQAVHPQAIQTQGSGSLTPRLVRAMSRKGPVCVIGTDCPEVGARDVADAFKALRHADLVLGRADDGGFWLIGANGPVGAELFEGVRWSTETALDDVAKNAEGKVAFLRTLTDVDDVEALAAVRRRGRRFV